MLRIRLALITPLLCAVAFAAAQNPVRDFLCTSDRAIGLLPARPVGGPGATTLSWSSSGRYLLVVASSLPPEISASVRPMDLASFQRLSGLEELSLTLYDSMTGVAQLLWKAPKARWTMNEPQWLTGQDEAFVVTKVSSSTDGSPATTQAKIIRIDPETATLSDFFKVPDSITEPRIEITPSPTRPVAVVSILNRDSNVQAKPYRLFLIGEKVEAAHEINLDDQPYGASVSWSEDGRRPFCKSATESAQEKEAKLCLFLDFAHGVTAEVSTIKPYAEPAAMLKMAPDEAGNLWLSADGALEHALICRDAEQAFISPGGNALAFVCQGVAMVRPLLTMPIKDYWRLRTSADQAEGERRARQFYIWLLRYARGHDDELPADTAQLSASIGEVGEDPLDLTGCSYAFSGGKRSKIPHPEATLLGSIKMLTGMVYLFADGNVRWEPLNQPQKTASG